MKSGIGVSLYNAFTTFSQAIQSAIQCKFDIWFQKSNFVELGTPPDTNITEAWLIINVCCKKTTFSW